MNKNYKSNFLIHILIPLVLAIWLNGCYTQLDTTSLEKSESRNYSQLTQPIDNNIVGAWQKRNHWSDAPENIQQLIFYTNGKMLFEDKISKFNQTSVPGSYFTKDSILTIVLDYGYGTDKYYYKVFDGTLSLTPYDMDTYYPYKITNYGSSIWFSLRKKGNL